MGLCQSKRCEEEFFAEGNSQSGEKDAAVLHLDGVHVRDDCPPYTDRLQQTQTKESAAAAEIAITRVPTPSFMPNIPICTCEYSVEHKHNCVAANIVIDSNGRVIEAAFFASCLGRGRYTQSTTARCAVSYCTGSDIVPTMSGEFCAQHAMREIKNCKGVDST